LAGKKTNGNEGSNSLFILGEREWRYGNQHLLTHGSHQKHTRGGRKVNWTPPCPQTKKEVIRLVKGTPRIQQKNFLFSGPGSRAEKSTGRPKRKGTRRCTTGFSRLTSGDKKKKKKKGGVAADKKDWLGLGDWVSEKREMTALQRG